MRCLAGMAVVAVLILPSGQVLAESPQKAQDAFAQGQASLAQGDFDGALRAFKRAARGHRGNQSYAQQYALVRQIVKLRKKLPRERNPERWLSGASALHAFYHENKLYAESLPLDLERIRRAPSAESAVALAKTQLALKRNSEAAGMLAALQPELQSPHTKVLYALALARIGRLDQARELVASGGQPDIEEPDFFLDLARVHVALDQPQGALRFLKRSLQLTPPSRLDEYRVRLGSLAELAGLAGSPAFADVMKTASTIKESPCSGGSGCSKCPKRAKCATTKGNDKRDKP